MILYLKDPKNSTKKLLEIINNFGKVAGYSNLLIYQQQTEKEIRERIPFTRASKIIKYLGINLSKETNDPFKENYKPLKR
jgi:predicted AlkP superfamily phosphohydrolase/phosphomutase